MFVAISGNIGAGKSSLTGILAERYALAPVYEAVDENPYLEDFYKDMPRYAFHSQMFFLAKRLDQHLEKVNPGNRVIQDRTVYEDANIFARNLFQQGIMSRRDFDSYMQMYAAVSRALRPPDLMIYLRADLKTLKHRIGLRGRDYEADISDTYLENLNELYEGWIDAYDLSPTVVLEGDTLDFVNRAEDLDIMLERLEPYGLSRPILNHDAR